MWLIAGRELDLVLRPRETQVAHITIGDVRHYARARGARSSSQYRVLMLLRPESI